MNRLRVEGRASIEAAKSEVKRIDRELDKLVKLILVSGDDDTPIRIMKQMKEIEGKKSEFERFLADAEEPPPHLHPEMANFYRMQVRELYEALQEEAESKRMKAADLLRSLVKEIILTPQNGTLQIDVRGDLAGILAISLKSKTPTTRAGASQVEMVAGTGFEPVTFRL
jgi:site-specific DNA recombinase